MHSSFQVPDSPIIARPSASDLSPENAKHRRIRRSGLAKAVCHLFSRVWPRQLTGSGSVVTMISGPFVLPQLLGETHENVVRILHRIGDWDHSLFATGAAELSVELVNQRLPVVTVQDVSLLSNRCPPRRWRSPTMTEQSALAAGIAHPAGNVSIEIYAVR
jgi:hypothetical protein